MGRGSDTRMYAPRSDSDHMYSANDGDDKYNPTDPEYKEKEEEKKQFKQEKKQNLRSKLKHIKIKRHHGTTMGPEPDMTEEGQDDANKRDIDGEISRQTGSPGSRGHLLDMATGAKTGTGSAMGDSLFATGEPMNLAFRMLKGVDEKGYDFSEESEDDDIRPGESSLDAALRRRQGGSRFTPTKQLSRVKGIPTGKRLNVSTTEHLPPPPSKEEKLQQSLEELAAENPNINVLPSKDKKPDEDDEIILSEPMDDAWSTLLKLDTPKTIAERRKREERQHFRPSTGQFKTPPGGQSGGVGATMRRFKNLMRGIKSGKKTGLMRSPLAVEMSHRGIKTKQPKSKSPIEYRPYMGQQETRKILGGVRTTYSPSPRHSQRRFYAGPTGAGRLTGMLPGQGGQMRQPSLKRMGMPRMRKPRMPRSPPPMGMPPMPPQGDGSMVGVAPPLPSVPDPSQIMMSEDKIPHSDLVKMNYSDLAEIKMLLRRMTRAAETEAKESKKKMQGQSSAMEDGAVPSHGAGVSAENDDEMQGGTQNDEMKANRLGLDPASVYISRRGHMG